MLFIAWDYIPQPELISVGPPHGGQGRCEWGRPRKIPSESGTIPPRQCIKVLRSRKQATGQLAETATHQQCNHSLKKKKHQKRILLPHGRNGVRGQSAFIRSIPRRGLHGSPHDHALARLLQDQAAKNGHSQEMG